MQLIKKNLKYGLMKSNSNTIKKSFQYLHNLNPNGKLVWLLLGYGTIVAGQTLEIGLKGRSFKK